MVALENVRASNAALKSLPSGLVAVFVGGTSGIGLYTARELVRNTISPHVYLIGRNQTEATKIISELKTINPSSEVSFIQKDVSLLKNVDEACKEIKSKEKQVNLLFMTCGYFVMTGRNETSEGLDRKFALHYYTRMRFVDQLQPLLTAAATAKTLSRVVAVLDPQPGLRLTPDFSDPSLKTTFSLKNCMVHASSMTNLAFSRLAFQNPGTSYIHAFPAVVDSGAGRDAFGPFKLLAKPIMWALTKAMEVKPAESGERHLYAATSPTFAPKSSGGVEEVAIGGDGVKGSGSYSLNWNGDILADTAKAKKLRGEGGEDKVLQHTKEVFETICEKGKKKGGLCIATPSGSAIPGFVEATGGNLANKVVLVSGAARGLGLTQAEALLEAGAKVYALDRLPEPSPDFHTIAARAKSDLGTSLAYRQIDVRDVINLNKIVQEIADAEGRLDGLIAAAGIQQETPALEYTAEDANRMFEVNMTGVFMTAQAVAKQMIRFGNGGSIVMIASMSGSIANRGLICAAYNASKAGVIQLGRNLAAEWGKHNIRVNTISPGYIVTAMVEELFVKYPDRKADWPTQNMLGRLSKPQEYRGAAVFLISDASSFMTGADLKMDGGHSAW
ncbi:NAD(P)-binding protein [Setomelanomma holmii]|uniref:NAD(P)-binding protein n=1 Tax=Setomelanomma holmii TaxID=210430 RepID=A0A9P4H8S1_9PLEO|nr:NAD(P)-binding protein [Setomelanomma holmii]